jgi:hypothetical protein
LSALIAEKFWMKNIRAFVNLERDGEGEKEKTERKAEKDRREGG